MNHPEIIEYGLVITGTTKDLVEAVNRQIRQGYQPLGPVTARSGQSLSSVEYIQTMVKFKKTEQ